MRSTLRHGRLLADVLTLSRVLLAVLLALVGWLRGPAGLPMALTVLLLSWLTDLLDGPLARRDANPQPTWIGRHDAEADLSTALGVAAYLALSGYIHPGLGVALVAATLGVWFLHSHQLAWPLYAIPYAILAWVAFDEAPAFGWVVMGYLAGTLAVGWRRLRAEYLPEFFRAVAGLRGWLERRAPGAHKGHR